MGNVTAMLYRADHVIAGDGEVIAAGAVRVEGNRIAEVGPAATVRPQGGEEIVDLQGHVLSPGFINVHCNLD